MTPKDKDVIVEEGKLYILDLKPVTFRTIESRRRRLATLIASRIEQNRELRDSIRRNEVRIEHYQHQLDALNSPTVQAAVEHEKKRAEEADVKAAQLMLELLGEEVYNTLQSKRYVTFKAKDGLRYKITNKGTVYRRDGKQWRTLCIIRPKELPLPDVVTAILISVREQPDKYGFRRGR